MKDEETQFNKLFTESFLLPVYEYKQAVMGIRSLLKEANAMLDDLDPEDDVIFAKIMRETEEKYHRLFRMRQTALDKIKHLEIRQVKDVSRT